MKSTIKKLKVNKFLLILIAFVTIFSSCQKDEIDTTTPELIEETNLETFNLYGAIVDANNDPVADALVIVDDNMATTDANGIYFFNQIRAQAPRVKLSVVHSGFFKAYKTIEVTSNRDYKLDAKLTDLNNDYEIKALDGGEVVSSEGIKINFPPDCFVKEDGSSYSDGVHVYVTRLDPAESSFDYRFPSDFDIINLDNEKKILQAFAGVGVELYSTTGEALQINKNVTIDIPVNDKLISEAPSSIVLGSYDDNKGYWVEEGIATLAGDSYTMEVSHFSNWCCLVMNDPTQLVGFVFEDINGVTGIPVNDLFVKVTHANSGAAAYTRTLDDGFFSIRIPKNEDLEVAFYSNSFNTTCDDPVYTESIPGVSDFHNMGNVLIDSPDMITVTGTVLDCSQQNISEGFIIIENQEDDIVVSRIQSDGSFSISMYSCSTEANITAYDINFTSMSETLVIPDLTSDVALGNMVACELVNMAPFILKVFTGGDTLIGTNSTGFENSSSGTLAWAYFDMDIQNTSQPLGEGAASVIISLDGLEDALCDVYQIQIAIPLLDSDGIAKIGRVQPSWGPTSDSWVQTYNCIDGSEYLHLVGEAYMVDGTGQLITHRDPLMEFEIYFPL